jgi:hypothetical protein
MRDDAFLFFRAHTLLKHTRALADTFSVEDEHSRCIATRSHTRRGIAAFDVRNEGLLSLSE